MTYPIAVLLCRLPRTGLLAVIACWIGLVAVSSAAIAQSNVRAWYASGQVFVVWRVDTTAPLTYDVYRSNAPITSTAQGTLVGRVFEPEWTGARLKLVKDTATWRVPSPSGGFYQLAINEGLFVFTPRAAGSGYFTVVKNGVTAVAAANTMPAPLLYAYDPSNDPVQCHLQLADRTSRDYPFRTFAMWVDGDDVASNARPDFPLMANSAKRGAPHVFTVFEPKSGLPQGTFPAMVCLHGGGQQGSHWAWAPESFHYANDDATPTVGITVAMDDRLFVAANGVVSLDRPTNWFGWHAGMDPITALPAPSSAIVEPYTLRRLIWTLDWLQVRSPYAVDPKRTAVMGNSMGGAGTLLLSRWRPDRFSSATAFVPQHYTPETGSRLFGTPALNLLTSEIGPSGAALRVNDFFDAAVRLSPQQRDFCFTRIVRGRRDESVNWGPLTLQLFQSMNAGRFGTHLYWDNRDHTASDWTTDDLATPGVDIAEWIVPVRTERMGAPYQARYQALQSYPAFHDDDQDLTISGRQPSLGNGLPDDGTPWGTWGGYFDWDLATLFDLPTGWACSMFLIGQSTVAVDNCPVARATTGVTVRMPRRFRPSVGASVAWTLRDVASDAALQSGAITVGADGLVTVAGLSIPRDPARVRLECRIVGSIRPGDLNGDGFVDVADLDQARIAPVDLDGDGLANNADIDMLERFVRRNGPLASAAAFGRGCVSRSRSFYEHFAPSAFDLQSACMRLTYGSTGQYVASSIGAYLAPTAAATVLPLGDDGVALVQLSSPLAFPGGVTSTLEVCANGFVSAGSGNEPSFTPTVSAWLSSTRARWGCWHDFNPQAFGGGRIKVEQMGGVTHITWEGVYSYGTTSAATFQLQFDPANSIVTLVFGPVVAAGNEWLVGFAAPGPNADLGERDLSIALPLTFATDAVELTPVSLASSRPELGSVAVLTSSNLPPSTVGVVQALGFAPLPNSIDLSGIGMPGCFQHAELAEVYFVVPSGSLAFFAISVPYDLVLLGQQVYAQSAGLAAGFNAAGLVTSNGVMWMLGL